MRRTIVGLIYVRRVLKYVCFMTHLAHMLGCRVSVESTRVVGCFCCVGHNKRFPSRPNSPNWPTRIFVPLPHLTLYSAQSKKKHTRNKNPPQRRPHENRVKVALCLLRQRNPAEWRSAKQKCLTFG